MTSSPLRHQKYITIFFFIWDPSNQNFWLRQWLKQDCFRHIWMLRKIKNTAETRSFSETSRCRNETLKNSVLKHYSSAKFLRAFIPREAGSTTTTNNLLDCDDFRFYLFDNDPRPKNSNKNVPTTIYVIEQFHLFHCRFTFAHLRQKTAKRPLSIKLRCHLSNHSR